VPLTTDLSSRKTKRKGVSRLCGFCFFVLLSARDQREREREREKEKERKRKRERGKREEREKRRK